ncbi:MAG: hypothetical protein HYY18_01075 [Planctomycetes bacterium]|nr:hypothetical protein [Planctomycetota bacterium]
MADPRLDELGGRISAGGGGRPGLGMYRAELFAPKPVSAGPEPGDGLPVAPGFMIPGDPFLPASLEHPVFGHTTTSFQSRSLDRDSTFPAIDNQSRGFPILANRSVGEAASSPPTDPLATGAVNGSESINVLGGGRSQSDMTLTSVASSHAAAILLGQSNETRHFLKDALQSAIADVSLGLTRAPDPADFIMQQLAETESILVAISPDFFRGVANNTSGFPDFVLRTMLRYGVPQNEGDFRDAVSSMSKDRGIMGQNFSQFGSSISVATHPTHMMTGGILAGPPSGFGERLRKLKKWIDDCEKACKAMVDALRKASPPGSKGDAFWREMQLQSLMAECVRRCKTGPKGGNTALEPDWENSQAAADEEEAGETGEKPEKPPTQAELTLIMTMVVLAMLAMALLVALLATTFPEWGPPTIAGGGVAAIGAAVAKAAAVLFAVFGFLLGGSSEAEAGVTGKATAGATIGGAIVQKGVEGVRKGAIAVGVAKVAAGALGGWIRDLLGD